MSKPAGSGRLNCSFCSKGSDAVKKLIAGPGVYICDECVKECDDLVIAEKQSATTKSDPQSRCSFCSKRGTQVEHILKGPKYRICDECLDLCHDILSEEGTEPWASSHTPSVSLPQDIKLSREVVLDAIVSYVCGAEHWEQLFKTAMEQTKITPSDVEAAIEAKRRAGTPVIPEDFLVTLGMIMLSTKSFMGGKT